MTSGQLELHGVLDEWTDIRYFLNENDTSRNEEFTEDWSADWSWKDENLGKSKKSGGASSSDDQSEKKSSSDNDGWLSKCLIANSPVGDVFALCKGTKAVFFTGEWRTNRMRFSTSFQGVLAQEPGETISSVSCIPLVSKKRTNPGSPDWTCFVVGFSSGYVRIYTENGSVLITQLFHNQSVQSFKMRSYIPATSSLEHDQLEELIVLYKSVIVTMDGFGLFQTLRACRNHLARLKANAAEGMIDPPPLTYKKWGFEKGELINDCEVLGLRTPTTFDHLVNGSILGGLNAKISPVPLTSNIFVSTGKNPYLAFHYAQEGQAVPLLTEIAFAMASKLKSSLISAASGWLGFGGGASSAKAIGSPQVPKEKPKIEPPTIMSCRLNIPDNPRLGESILMSPCRKLSVVTDVLGRVILLDNELGISVRIWKGYRSAQCSWLQVEEEVTSKSSRGKEPRRATFLLIYSPQRGNLDVWAMQQGPKVATFNVSKTGRLLSTTYGMMGLNNIPLRSGNRPPVQSIFIDNEARIYTIRIPFHLALCDRTSSKVKDMHLLKALQRQLRDEKYTQADLFDILVQIRMQAMINQAFRLLSQKCKKLDIFVNILEAYMHLYLEDEEKDLHHVSSLQALLLLYSSLLKSTETPPIYIGENPEHSQTILHCLHATEKEMQVMGDMANKHSAQVSSPSAKSVSFGEEFLSVNEFLATLEIDYDPGARKVKERDARIKINFKSDNLQRMGTLLVCGCLNDPDSLAEWGKNLKAAGLIPSELLALALEFWVQKALVSSSYVGVMERLYKVVTTLCELEGYKNVTNEFGRVSKWWEDIRREITKSARIFHVYSFAVVCRAVAIDLQQRAEMESPNGGKGKGAGADLAGDSDDLRMDTDEEVAGPSNPGNDDSDWENMSLDLLKWNLLLKQFEDLHLLTAILNERPILEHPSLPVLTNTIESISVIQLLDKGKGCIAELVGKWLTTIGIDPRLIIDDEVITITKAKGKNRDLQHEEMELAREVEETDEGTNFVLGLLKSLRDNFSVSLTSSIILANYCWEYCLEWNKETNNVIVLDAAIKCATAISSPYVRQGIMSMMWTTFIVKKLSPVVTGNKSGKDKLSEKISGFPNPEKKQMFLNTCVHFLDVFMEAVVHCEGVQPPPINRNAKNHWSSAAASAALTDLALIQPHANYEMILLHYQLSLCTQFITVFRIRRSTMKPMNFFDTKAKNLLFQNMSNPAPFTNIEVDLSLRNLREEFLCHVICCAIREIQEELNDDEPKKELTQIKASEDSIRRCEEWTRKTFDLARIWGLDLDGLRISQTCEFYTNGFDSYGQEMIGTVSSRDILGPKLLVITGMRISYLMSRKTDNITEIIASFTTNFSNWLDSLDYSVLRCHRFSKESITELAQQILHLLPETSYDTKLAEEVLIAIDFI